MRASWLEQLCTHDVVEHVLQFLPLQSLVRLLATSKSLRAAVCIWACALSSRCHLSG